MRHLQGNEEWLQYDGMIVKIDGKRYRLKVTTLNAIYPYRHTVISVYAGMVNRNDPEYIKIMHELHDHWDTDVLDSDPELQASILEQCRRAHQPIPA